MSAIGAVADRRYEAERAGLAGWITIGAGLCAAALSAAAVALVSGLGGTTSPIGGNAAGVHATQAGWPSVPLPAQLAVSRAIGADQPAYRVHAGVARVAGQGLSARFSASGVAVEAAGGTARLGLRNAKPTAPIFRGNRVIYRRGGVTEWYANGPFGLEQGFTLTRAAPNLLPLASGGSLRARPQPGGTELQLVNARGRAVLTERGLSAWDAVGRPLRVRFRESARGSVAIAVDTAGAHFPVTVDPLVQTATLTASDGYAYEGDGATVNGSGIASGGLGYSAAIDGQTIAVGAPGAAVSYGAGLSQSYPSGVTNSYQGAVYVFTEPSSGWSNATETAKLFASDGQGAGTAVSLSSTNVYGDSLGSSVAISGDTIVTGAPRAVAGGQDYAGKLYVFTKGSAGWVTSFQTAELAAGNATQDDFLGSSMAFDGQTIVTAVPNRESSGFATSEAYVFNKPASGGWTSGTESATIADPTNSTSDEFGAALAVSGGTIAVGVPLRTDGGSTDAGAVDVVTRTGSTWGGSLSGTLLTPSSPVQYETVGGSVALDGTTLVAGATHSVGNGQPGPSGAAYVFDGSGGWSTASQARLTASDGSSGDAFGKFVAVAGSNIWVTGYPTGTQELYGYVEPPTGWTSATQSSESALSGTAASYYASSLAIQDGTVVAGEPGATPAGGPLYSGDALVFSSGTSSTTTTGPDTTTTGPSTTPTGPDTTPTTPDTTTPTATTSTPAASTTPGAAQSPAPASSGSGLTYTATPVYVDTSTSADIIAGLFGLKPGSGETENLGDFTFVAYCNKPSGQCAASTSFGQQLGTNTTAHIVSAAARKKAKPVIWGKGRISIKAKKHATVVVKLTKLGRQKLTKAHVLKGQLEITIGITSRIHSFTLHYKPKHKSKAKSRTSTAAR